MPARGNPGQGPGGATSAAALLGPAAEKQGAAQLFSLFFPFAFPFPIPLPFPFPLPFPLPFAFPFPLLPLALLLAALVGAVGVFAPRVAGLALWPEIFPVSPVLGTG